MQSAVLVAELRRWREPRPAIINNYFLLYLRFVIQFPLQSPHSRPARSDWILMRVWRCAFSLFLFPDLVTGWQLSGGTPALALTAFRWSMRPVPTHLLVHTNFSFMAISVCRFQECNILPGSQAGGGMFSFCRDAAQSDTPINYITSFQPIMRRNALSESELTS